MAHQVSIFTKNNVDQLCDGVGVTHSSGCTQFRKSTDDKLSNYCHCLATDPIVVVLTALAQKSKEKNTYKHGSLINSTCVKFLLAKAISAGRRNHQ